MSVFESDFQTRWQQRHQSHLRLVNCMLLGEDVNHRFVVDIQGTTIVSIIHRDDSAVCQSGDIDCRGMLLMPGLMDAHVHCTATTADLPAMLSCPESLTTARATHILRGMIMRGFTTVRDCGGADFGLAQAIEEGTVMGPRLLFTGHALSQTGGHGDMRDKGEDCFACGAALRGIGRVCDGDTEVRRAARDELRKGAHCIKIMASGGVSSPTDRLTNTQFSLQEITAIVEEAAAAGTYVCAHAYTSEAISRAVACGVRSIEHGNYLDEATAVEMVRESAFLVPTLVTYVALQEAGEAAGMKADLVAKVGDLVEQGISALGIARDAGVRMCYGSDLLGDLHLRQLEGLGIMGRMLTPRQVVECATTNAAVLFGLEARTGQVGPGFWADLILVDGNPYADLGVLCEQRIRMVIKEGVVMKNTL